MEKRTITIAREVLFICLIMIIAGCKNSKNNSEDASGDIAISEQILIPQNTTKYCKGNGTYDVLCYADEVDIGKTWKQLSTEKKSFFLLSIGNKVVVIHEKNINKKLYSKIRLPDDSIYWVESSFLTDKFAVVNKSDLLCYKMPDENYIISEIKLQPGDFGYIVETKDNWIKVDFRSYRGNGLSDLSKKNWVGSVWIKEGYTEDINAAKQGHYLYLSYYFELVKEDEITAKEMLEKGIAITNNIVTDIGSVLKERLEYFQSTSVKKKIPDVTTDRVH